MNRLEEIFCFIASEDLYISTKHEDDKVIVFEKEDLIFVFNFHPTKNFDGYQIGTKWGSKHKIILDSDEERFMGKGRLNDWHENMFPCIKRPFNNRAFSLKIYIPSRTCLVLIAEENIKKWLKDSYLQMLQSCNKFIICDQLKPEIRSYACYIITLLTKENCYEYWQKLSLDIKTNVQNN
jgi:hypothetical protein